MIKKPKHVASEILKCYAEITATVDTVLTSEKTWC